LGMGLIRLESLTLTLTLAQAVKVKADPTRLFVSNPG